MSIRSLGPRILAAPLPAWLIGSYGSNGQANVMTAAWCGVCCSKPPILGVSLRPATLTHGNILERAAFTINVPSAAMARVVDAAGMLSGRDGDKFAALGLTAVPSGLVAAPRVAECPIVVECRLHSVHELGMHTQFLGEVLDVVVHEELLDAKGDLDPNRLDLLAYCPEARVYYGLARVLGQAFRLGRREPEASS